MTGWTRLGVVASIVIGGYGHNKLATRERATRQTVYESTWNSCYSSKKQRPADAGAPARKL